MNVRYLEAEPFWDHYIDFILDTIDRYRLKNVCDAGGGANPLLSLEQIQQRNLAYTLLDISQQELDKSPEAYRKIVHDMTSSDPSQDGQYDFIFTKMMAEHVPDGEAFHRHVYSMLKSGGMAVHYFPTLYAPPFVVNKLLSDRIGGFIYNLLAPRDKYRYGRFPAYYRWCRGPTPGMHRRLEGVGFEVVEYWGLFGHRGYYRRIPFLPAIHGHLVRWLLKHPVPWLTSYAYVLVRKP